MTLSIMDIVNMPELGTRILSGRAGAGRPVRWAHVCELADPTEWLGEGDLLMTTGLGIPRDPSAQRLYATALAQAGLAGMMIGKDMQAPADLGALRQAADELGFPVLMTDYGVPFASVTRAVIDAQRAEEFARRTAITRVYASARLAIEGIALPDLLARLAQDVGAELVLWEPQTRQPWLPRGAVLPDRLHEALARQKPDASHTQPTVRRLALADGEALAIALPSRRKCLLLAFRRGRDLLDYSLLNHIAAVLGIALERLHVENERAMRQGAELLDDLLNQRLTRQQAGKRLAQSGIRLETAHLAIARRGGLSLSDWAALFERCETPLLLSPQGDGLMLLIPAGTTAAAAALIDASIGLSAPVGYFERLAEALREARLALTHADAARPLVLYADVADILPWLPQNLDEARETFRRVLGPLAAHDDQSRAALLPTLKAFLEENRSWQAAAARLHIHKASLTYRIRKIEALTGRSFSSTGDVAALWLALQAAEILGLPGAAGRSPQSPKRTPDHG